MNKIVHYWDMISEIEVDSTWKNHVPKGYQEYRQKFELSEKRKYNDSFPISFEIEATYYCNLKCPYCPRFASWGEREEKHLSVNLWEKILKESQKNGLKAIQMDHEAESLMNPKIFDMIEEAKNAGIIDIWLHTNANMLTPELSRRLIDSGITKINFSVDAFSQKT